MNPRHFTTRDSNRCLFLFLWMASGFFADAAPVEELIRTNQQGIVLTREGRVEYLAPRVQATPAQLNQFLDFGDALRTLELSRASVRFVDWSQFQMKDRTRLEIVRPANETNSPGIKLLDGELYFSSRGGGAPPVPIETPHVRGTPRGTEFLVTVDPAAGRTEFTMFDGEVELANAQGSVRVPSGRQGVAAAGQAPRLVPIIEAHKVVQWWIYYPGILDLDELGLNPAEQAHLAASLAAYRAGDLKQALETHPDYPALPAPPTDAQRVYLAGALLAVGAVERAQAQLTNVSATFAPARALRTMLAAVSTSALTNVLIPEAPLLTTNMAALTASEWLALSYAHQATNNLTAALEAARRAVRRSPKFGFGWARVAELEFSFGHTRASRGAVGQALKYSPRNAQAHAVRGFLFAADERMREAIAAFDEAIRLDSSLGNAWLGRGLCKIRLGFLGGFSISQSGLADIQTAALLEPTRSLTRSYAAKAFSAANDISRARKELAFARELDPNDPTPWLYSALQHWEENRINDAVSDVGKSIQLNDNRAVYRSRLLLDQDHATRSASLAKIYQSAGLDDVALREAAKAVSYDYASHSAHQFLAESYNALRDPSRFNLRYETVWFNELLLANLLSPVGAGLLSQNISQQEYSRLFEANRVGLLTSTEYRSDGQFREITSHYGLLGNTSYTLDLDYQHNSGTRPNNDLDRIEWYSQIKHQLTDRDSIFLLTKYQDYESGDNFQHYDPTNALRSLRVKESQAPIVLAAFHREWQPGMHTTLLAGRLESRVLTRDTARVLDLQTNEASHLEFVREVSLEKSVQDTRFEAYVGELNQVWQTAKSVTILGGRVQVGTFDVSSTLDKASNTNEDQIYGLPLRTELDEPFQRTSLYAYETYEVVEGVQFTVGMTYDRLRYPVTFRSAPLTDRTEHSEGLFPKVAVTWILGSNLAIRAAYMEALSGLVYDESVSLEPSQLAGFSQAFRSVISEAEAGSVIAPRHRVGGLAVDYQPGPRTFAGLEAQWVGSEVRQRLAVFRGRGVPSEVERPSSTPENLDYEEGSLGASIDQLVGDEWALGFSYRVTRSRMRFSYPEIPSDVFDVSPARHEEAILHHLNWRVHYAHPSGFFARATVDTWLQDDRARGAETLCQLNIFAGYRFWRRRAELSIGCLNVTDEDYRLSSLTPFPDLPRERVWTGKLRLDF